MLSADKRAGCGADARSASRAPGPRGCATLQLVLYYPVQAEDKEMKALSKKLRQSSGRSTIDSLTVEALFEMVGKGTKRDTLVSFVERASSVDPPSTAGSPDRDPSAFAYGLLFGYLQQCVRQREQVAQILKTLLGILRLGHPLLTPTRAARAAPHAHSRRVEFPRWTEEELAETRQAVAPLLQRRGARSSAATRSHAASTLVGRERAARAPAGRRLARPPTTSREAHLGLGALADATTVHFALDEQADWGAPSARRPRGAARRAADRRRSDAAIASMLFALFHNASPPLNIKPAKLAALPDAVVVQLAAQASGSRAAADGRGMVAEGLPGRAAVVAQASEVDGTARRRTRVTCSAPGRARVQHPRRQRGPRTPRCARCARRCRAAASAAHTVQPVRGRAARAADGGGGGGGGRHAAADDAAVQARAATTPCSGWRRRTSCCSLRPPRAVRRGPPPLGPRADRPLEPPRVIHRDARRLVPPPRLHQRKGLPHRTPPHRPRVGKDQTRAVVVAGRLPGARRRVHRRTLREALDDYYRGARAAAAQALRGALLPRAAARRRGEAVRDARLLRKLEFELRPPPARGSALAVEYHSATRGASSARATPPTDARQPARRRPDRAHRPGLTHRRPPWQVRVADVDRRALLFALVLHLRPRAAALAGVGAASDALRPHDAELEGHAERPRSAT